MCISFLDYMFLIEFVLVMIMIKKIIDELGFGMKVCKKGIK